MDHMGEICGKWNILMYCLFNLNVINIDIIFKCYDLNIIKNIYGFYQQDTLLVYLNDKLINQIKS